jgi:hypothetical protein
MSWMNILKKDLTSEQKSETDAYVASQDSITVRKVMQHLLKKLGFVKGSVGRRSIEAYLEEKYPDKLEHWRSY